MNREFHLVWSMWQSCNMSGRMSTRRAVRLVLGLLMASFREIHGEVHVNTSALMSRLFTDYHSDVRPMCEVDRAVQVSIGMALRQIVEMNERNQILEINAWMRLGWADCRLIWNPAEFGISSLILPYNRLWVPDITLYDNAETTIGGLRYYRQNLTSDGDVYYNFPSIVKSLCRLDVTYFPFDTQFCKLKFGSWMHHGFDLNVTLRGDSGDISSYIPNVEWDIVSVPAERNELIYGCCPEPYPDVTFYLIMRRKPLFYMLNLLFPCMLISTVAILGFLLPPDSGEKVSLEVTVLLSLAVFLLVVSETMPPTSETFPYIGVYFAMSMLLVSLSCLMTVTVLNLHFRGSNGKEVPAWVEQVFVRGLGRVLCVKGSRHTHTVYPKVTVPQATMMDGGGSVRSNTVENGHANHENNLNQSKFLKKELNPKNISLQFTDMQSSEEVVCLLHKQLEILRRLDEYLGVKRDREQAVDDWHLVAQVIDRLFLLVFSVIQIVTTLVILIRISTTETPSPIYSL